MKARFDSLKIAPALLEVIAELGFTELTQIQAESLPLLLGGRDLIGQSKTGSGKTLAFSLPILNRLDISRRQVQALILCPTRELAVQVTREIRRLGRRLPGLSVASLVGGQPMRDQLGGLRMGAHIAVGTPGRVLDHLKRRSLDLQDCAQVVLDEADRMLDMGFEEQMQEVLRELPPERQTMLFSATFPDSIEKISEAYQNKPARVTITDAAPEVEQLFFPVEEADKLSALLWAFRHFEPEQAIVFCNLKATVVELTECLETAGISAAGLQGDLEQSDRDRVMAKFRNASIRALVATDVAARGIDVADLALVVNFDLPKPDVYLHRIGRTGRAGKKGRAISFAQERETYKVEMIEAVAQVERRDLPEEELELAAEGALAAPAKMTTLFISGGRKEKMRPGDILGALTGEAGGFDGADIGKIEIHDHFSYVAVSSRVAEPAMHRLREGRIKGRKFRIELVR
ncbi:MAG: ATP-dependent RNA helicase DbpA [Bdellovibrionota bacterium]